MTALLGIDIGTSSTKAALYTTRGEFPARYNLSYRVQISQTGWAE
jgi:sugar (pentulose or hexulose) kinase